MKCLSNISFILGILIGLAACTGPIILEEPDDAPTHTGQSGTPTEDTLTKDSVAIIHEGTFASPYSIAEAQTLGRSKEVWIEGYIVGSVKGSMKSGCNFSQEAMTLSNILLADTFPFGNENDYLRCMPIELPGNSIEREELNLYDNPENYHQKVRIQGDITLYYNTTGIRKISDYIFTEDIEIPNEEEDDNDDENDNESGNEEDFDSDATHTDTLTIAEGIALQSEDDYIQATIKGYIVGYSKGNKNVTFPDIATMKDNKVTENVAIADNIDETDPNKVIIVELPKGYIREDVNLYDNPHNLHKRLTITGRMRPYYGLAGCRETLGTENRKRFLLE